MSVAGEHVGAHAYIHLDSRLDLVVLVQLETCEDGRLHVKWGEILGGKCDNRH